MLLSQQKAEKKVVCYFLLHRTHMVHHQIAQRSCRWGSRSCIKQAEFIINPINCRHGGGLSSPNPDISAEKGKTSRGLIIILPFLNDLTITTTNCHPMTNMKRFGAYVCISTEDTFSSLPLIIYFTGKLVV